MPFTKGQSGNPGGRPKQAEEIRDLARSHTKAAIERLVYWMNSNTPGASVAATTALLDRGWGKSVQFNENYNRNDVERLSDDELARLLSERLLGGPAMGSARPDDTGHNRFNQGNNLGS